MVVVGKFPIIVSRFLPSAHVLKQRDGQQLLRESWCYSAESFVHTWGGGGPGASESGSQRCPYRLAIVVLFVDTKKACNRLSPWQSFCSKHEHWQQIQGIFVKLGTTI